MITFKQFLTEMIKPTTMEFNSFHSLTSHLLKVDPSRRLLITFALKCAMSVLHYNNETTLPLATRCIRLLQTYLKVMDYDNERLVMLRTELNTASNAAWVAAWAAATAAARAAATAAARAAARAAATTDAAYATAYAAAYAAADASYAASYTSDDNTLGQELMNYGKQLIVSVDKNKPEASLNTTIAKFIKKNVSKLTLPEIEEVLLKVNDEGIIENLIDYFKEYLDSDLIGNIVTEGGFEQLAILIYSSVGNRLLLQTWLRGIR